MDFTWTPAQQSLREQARSVAVSAVERFGRANDSWINGWSKEFALELGELGWIGLTWPTEFGGGGRPPIERLIIGEELIKVGAPIGSMWFADRQMGPTLITYGRPDQQAEFLPSILTGASTWCIGMSEPNACGRLVSAHQGSFRCRQTPTTSLNRSQTSSGGTLGLPPRLPGPIAQTTLDERLQATQILPR